MEKEERIDIFDYYPPKRSSLATLFLLGSIKLSPLLTNFTTLEHMGFVNLFLYDETEGNIEYYEDGILLVFNPSVSFFVQNWSNFELAMKEYKNFITVVKYDYCLYGVWFKIHKEFSQGNLRYLFKKGEYSKFPKNYATYLIGDCEKIVKQEEDYRIKLEKRLGLEDGELIGKELASVPEKESYTFKYLKINQE